MGDAGSGIFDIDRQYTYHDRLGGKGDGRYGGGEGRH
jgi:hypothetical protein